MDAESKSEILAKLDLMIEIMKRFDARQDRMEARQDRTDNAIDSIRAEFIGMAKDVAGLREYVFEFRGEVRGRIDGLSERISDVNSRLPVPIAYAPPGKPAA